MEYNQSCDEEWQSIGSWNTVADVRGVKFISGTEKWEASIVVDDKCFNLGLYETHLQAALAHDMEAFRAFGFSAHEHLNSKYDIRKSSQSFFFEVKDSFGTIISIDIRAVSSEGEEAIYFPLGPPQVKSPSFDMITPMVLSSGFPSAKAEFNRRWFERTSTSYLPSASFSYEITFQYQNSLGLNLKPYAINYSIGGGGRYIGCCVVMDALNAPIATIVQPGDILLKINESSLLMNQIEGFSFETITKIIAASTTPRTIRFMRPAGSSPNLFPSPIEIMLLHNEPHTSAKYNITTNPASAGQSKQPTSTLSMTHLDPSAPAQIRRLLQGQRVPWEYPPIPQDSRELAQLTAADGVIKDRLKFMAVLLLQEGSLSTCGSPSPATDTHYCLGRFDSEEEARQAHGKTLSACLSTGRPPPLRTAGMTVRGAASGQTEAAARPTLDTVHQQQTHLAMAQAMGLGHGGSAAHFPSRIGPVLSQPHRPQPSAPVVQTGFLRPFGSSAPMPIAALDGHVQQLGGNNAGGNRHPFEIQQQQQIYARPSN